MRIRERRRAGTLPIGRTSGSVHIGERLFARRAMLQRCCDAVGVAEKRNRSTSSPGDGRREDSATTTADLAAPLTSKSTTPRTETGTSRTLLAASARSHRRTQRACSSSSVCTPASTAESATLWCSNSTTSTPSHSVSLEQPEIEAGPQFGRSCSSARSCARTAIVGEQRSAAAGSELPPWSKSRAMSRSKRPRPAHAD